jgi:hypothetical protein
MFDFGVTQLPSSDISDRSLLDLRDRVTRSFSLCKAGAKIFRQIMLVFGKYLRADVMQFMEYGISHRRSLLGIQWVS